MFENSAKPVEPKIPTVLASSCPDRVSKEKAGTTIRVVTIPKSRVPHAPTISRDAPIRSLPSASHQLSPSFLGGESSEVDDSYNDRENLMRDIQRMITGSIIEAFAPRDGKEKVGEFTNSLPTALVTERHSVDIGNAPLPPRLSFLFPLCPNVFSLVDHEIRKILSRALPPRTSRLTICQSFIVPIISGMCIWKDRWKEFINHWMMILQKLLLTLPNYIPRLEIQRRFSLPGKSMFPFDPNSNQ